MAVDLADSAAVYPAAVALVVGGKKGLIGILTRRDTWILLIGFALAVYVNTSVTPTWTVEKITLDVQRNANGELFYIAKNSPKFFNPHHTP